MKVTCTYLNLTASLYSPATGSRALSVCPTSNQPAAHHPIQPTALATLARISLCVLASFKRPIGAKRQTPVGCIRKLLSASNKRVFTAHSKAMSGSSDIDREIQHPTIYVSICDYLRISNSPDIHGSLCSDKRCSHLIGLSKFDQEDLPMTEFFRIRLRPLATAPDDWCGQIPRMVS